MSDRIEQIPIEKIRWPGQERKQFDPVALAALAETIKLHGVEQPITVFANGDGFTGLLGERRWRAGKAAGLTTIPAIVRKAPSSEAQVIELRLVENVSRQDLNPIELAEGLAQLMHASKGTASAAAARTGLTNSHVSKTLQLLKLSDAIREQIRAGHISAGAGYVLAQIDDANQQSQLADKIVSGAVTRDQISAMVRRKRSMPSSAPVARVTRVAAALGGGRTITMSGGGISSLDVMIEWLEELLVKARKARPQGLAVQTFAKMLKDQAKRAALPGKEV